MANQHPTLKWLITVNIVATVLGPLITSSTQEGQETRLSRHSRNL